MSRVHLKNIDWEKLETKKLELGKIGREKLAYKRRCQYDNQIQNEIRKNRRWRSQVQIKKIISKQRKQKNQNQKERIFSEIMLKVQMSIWQ